MTTREIAEEAVNAVLMHDTEMAVSKVESLIAREFEALIEAARDIAGEDCYCADTKLTCCLCKALSDLGVEEVSDVDRN